MSTNPLTISSSSAAPLSVSGLASGLDTSAIIAALIAVQRQPITRLSNQQTELQAEHQQLQSIQTNLQQLSFAASEFGLPTLFENNQTVSSSAPNLIGAVATGGAGTGAYEVEVTRLASSSQRTFTYTSPGSEQQVTIEGQQFNVSAGETAASLASAINSAHGSKVYAAVIEGSTLVLSSRSTGSSGGEFVKVSSPGGALVEKEGTAREGRNAEFTVDGVAGSSATNTVTNAVAGVTLTLNGLTTAGNPVTVNVGAPGPSVSALEAQVNGFVKLYNSTVEAIGKQLAARPPAHPGTTSELGSGRLYQDPELGGLLASMRQAMYEPIAGLSAEYSSPASIGISTGAPSGSAATSTAALEGQLKLDPSKLTSALQANPAAVQEMLQSWSLKLQQVVGAAADPGAGIDTRLSAGESQMSDLSHQISSLGEALAQRERALQQTYAKLEAVISQNTAQSNWLTSQEKTTG